MPRVAPGGGQEDDDTQIHHLHHHTPNTRHYHDVAHGKNKNVLVNFEQYTMRNSEEAEDAPQGSQRRSQEYRSEGRSSRDQGRGDVSQQGYYPPKENTTTTTTKTYSTSTRQTTSTPKKAPFIQCDVLAFIIVLAYVLCIAIFVLAIWCYRQDTFWNSIVRNERAFPELANENFFGGKHLYIYENEEGLRHAKKHMLRENRWLELMHLLFMGGFLTLTIFQLAAYVTRGFEDHSRLIICYYTVFGGLGLIVALFPLLSWHNQENSYKVATHYLHDFSRRVWQVDKDHWRPGITNATAQDTWTLGQIMKFCHDVSQDGVNIEEDVRFFSLFKRHYKLSHFQHLGFCTHHKFKIINTTLSAIFALLCCAIPCIYCFQAGEKEKVEMAAAVERKRALAQQQIQESRAQEERGAPRKRSRKDYPEHKPPSHYRTSGGGDLTERQQNEIEKFRRYVEAEDEEH